MEILAKLYNNPMAGHFIEEQTYKLVSQRFFWPGMQEFVADYYKACGVCQGSRVIHGKQQGLLQPLPIPSNPWE
jgi:hypothetical protein